MGQQAIQHAEGLESLVGLGAHRGYQRRWVIGMQGVYRLYAVGVS